MGPLGRHFFLGPFDGGRLFAAVGVWFADRQGVAGRARHRGRLVERVMWGVQQRGAAMTTPLSADERKSVNATYSLFNRSAKKRYMSDSLRESHSKYDEHFGHHGVLARLRIGSQNVSRACGVLLLLDQAAASGVHMPAAGEHNKPFLVSTGKSGRATRFWLNGACWCYECGSGKDEGEVCKCGAKGRCDTDVFAPSVHGVSAISFADQFTTATREHDVSMSFLEQLSPCVWQVGTGQEICGWCRVCGIFIRGTDPKDVGYEQREKELWSQHTQCSEHKFFRGVEDVRSGLIIGGHLQSNPDSVVDTFLENLHKHILALVDSVDAVLSG